MQTPNEKIAAPEWIKMSELRPPKNATVLMWYPGTEMVGPWCKVDRLENIVLCFPEYWSRINPPNEKSSATPTRGVNRDSGTASANGGWLRRLVRHHGQPLS